MTMVFLNNFKSYAQEQAGVTLLLAVLILSAVTAISFSLATVAFVEIRASADVVRSEPALYVTQGQIEEAIFKVKRQIPDADSRYTVFNANFGTCDGNSATSTINSVKVNSRLCDRNLDNIYYAVVTTPNNKDVTGANLKKSLYFPLVDPSTFNGALSVTNSYPASYSRVIFKYASPSGYADVRVYICKEVADAATPCTNTDGVQDTNGDYITGVSGKLLNAATTPNYGSGCNLTSLTTGMICYELDVNTSYSLYLQYDSNNPGSLAAKFAYVQIKTCGIGTLVDSECPSSTGRGLYFPGKKTVDISALSAGNLLTRKYRVFIPE